MKQEELTELAKKYLDGTASDPERERLLTWYRNANDSESVWPVEHAGEEDQVRLRLLRTVLRHAAQSTAPSKRRSSRFLYPAAAAILAGIAVAGGLWLFQGNTPQTVPHTHQRVAVPAQQAENRYVMLPDSSLVLLRSGSSLQYLNDFSGATREIELIGEGYFDIKSRPEQPFIIHTGTVKTTVLGTSFNIRATEGTPEVTVTVASGRVLVEDGDLIRTELTADQQVTYHRTEKTVARSEVASTATALHWTKADLFFDAVPFGELADRLARRYDIGIDFEHESMKNCPISGGFDGMDTLEDILEVLCATRNATFERQGSSVLIKGEGCG